MSVVVLPAPLGPRKPTISPGAIPNEMPSTARTARVFRRTRLFVAASEARLALGDVEDLLEPVDVDCALAHPDRFSFPCFFAYCSPRLKTQSPSGTETAPISSSGQISSHIAVRG